MSRKQKQKQAALPPIEEQLANLVVLEGTAEELKAEIANIDEVQQMLDDAEIEEEIAKPNSVVPRKYKVKYRDRARANGQTSKAAKRSAWDWLAQTMAQIVLDKRNKLIVEALLSLLDANGVDHSRWTNRSKGWEGRLRMTGRLALQRVVAEKGVLHTADGEELLPPEEWVMKYRN